MYTRGFEDHTNTGFEQVDLHLKMIKNKTVSTGQKRIERDYENIHPSLKRKRHKRPRGAKLKFSEPTLELSDEEETKDSCVDVKSSVIKFDLSKSEKVEEMTTDEESQYIVKHEKTVKVETSITKAVFKEEKLEETACVSDTETASLDDEEADLIFSQTQAKSINHCSVKPPKNFI